MIRTARGPVRGWLKLTRFKGITLPPFGVFLLAEHMGNQRLRLHEEEHWRQAQELGTIKFYALYLWYYIRHTYWTHPMEVAARKAEERIQ
jgi:hypothetical protein